VERKRIYEEFRSSLLRPLKTDVSYRRIVATAADVLEFCKSYRLPDEEDRLVEVEYGRLRVAVGVHVVTMMRRWVEERSDRFTLEVQGRFLARRRAERLLIDEFIPLPSFCQSLACETDGPADRRQRFGEARMRSISVDDIKPLDTQSCLDLGIFADVETIPIDPLKVPIPFHSHYIKSDYQHGPSPGDVDGLFHLKWLYAPASGKNILYSGVTDECVELPCSFDPADEPETDAVSPTNPQDCRVEFRSGDLAGRSFTIPLEEEGVVVGRGDSCGLRIDDDLASREHARLYWSQEGTLVVEDLNSSNGTIVGDVRIRGSKTVINRSCDLWVGRTRLRVTI